MLRRPSGEIERLLQSQLDELPQLLLTNLVEKKLTDLKVPDPKGNAERLAKHILAEGGANFRIENADDAGPDQELAIEFTEEDGEGLTAAADRFMASLPELIEKVSATTSASIFRRLKKDWPEQWAWQQSVEGPFRENLEARWGEPFTLLRMLLTVSREIGAEQHAKHNRSRARRPRHRRDVLFRLHVRACQITAEIMALMEAGFADGAMARWRTLHEIDVVATVIADQDDDLAKRYLDHEVIEARRAALMYDECHEELGYRPLSARQRAKIERDFDAMKKRYGAAFAEGYGWAAHHLKVDGKRFSDLEKAAGQSSMRSYYKFASYNVHAGIKGITYRLGLLDRRVMLAGASNAGFEEPLQNTAVTLTRITSLLLDDLTSIDDQVVMRVLLKLQDEIPPAAMRAARKLKRDDLAVRRSASTG